MTRVRPGRSAGTTDPEDCMEVYGAAPPPPQLPELDVTITRTADGDVRVELVDKRTLVELLSLEPRDAATLAGWFAAKAVEAGQRRRGHDPGS